MSSGNRPDFPALHALARTAMRIVVAVVVIVAGITIVSYFALGRPDALFAGGAFPQLVSGAQNVAAAVPAPGAALATILRVAAVGLVVGLVLLIGAAGIWDAWQSRQRRDGQAPSATGRLDGDTRPRDARRRSPFEPDRSLRASDAEPVWSRERAPTDPDTLQGGTA